MQLHCKEWAKRGVTTLLALVFVVMAVSVPLAGAAVTKDQINGLKNQASSLATQKANLQSQLDKLSNSKNAAADQKRLLEQKINVLQQEIQVSEQSIAQLAQMIVQKEGELAQAQEKEAKYYDDFCQRIRRMEETGDVSYWSVIFDAQDFSDLLDRLSMGSWTTTTW